MTTMNIVKECLSNSKNIEENILRMIENDMEDGLDLLKISRNDIEFPTPTFILVENKLTIFLKTIEDYVYDIEILDINLKMKYIEQGRWYNEVDKRVVNKYLLNCSLILLDNNEEFLDYLRKTYNEEKYDDLLKYYLIKKNGWIKPRFNILNLFKINF